MAIGHWNESVLDLIPAYRATRKALTQARERTQEKAEKERLGEMLGDVEYILEWLETGRKPGQLRGVERRYERAWDPQWIDRYHSPSGWTVEREKTRELTADERFRIEEAMRDLSPRERQCFMMYHVDGMSEYGIAQELHLGRSTVHTFLERAAEKIEYAKVSSLFLLE